MRLNQLITTSAAVLIGLSVTVSAITFISLKRVDHAQESASNATQFALAASSAKYDVVQIQQLLTDASLTREKKSVDDAKNYALQLDQVLDEMLSTHPDKEKEINQIKKQAHLMIEAGLEMTAAYWNQGEEAGNAIMKREETGLDARSEALAQLLETMSNDIEKIRVAETNTQIKELSGFKFRSLLISIVSILTSIVAFSYIRNRLQPTLQIAQSLQDCASDLQNTAHSLKKNSHSLADANSSQASATQQTAASLEEIRSMVERTSDESKILLQSTNGSEKAVNQGKSSLEDVLRNLQEISSRTDQLAEDIQTGNREIMSIVDIISEIGSKTKVINDIVFQTKLLSFNASVEAARAGEHGKGFAVVAEEVGNLASMSGQSAKEISTMLESGIERVQKIIEGNSKKIEVIIAGNKETIGSGTVSAEQCKTIFDQIVDQVATVGKVSSEITSAIEEQSKGIDEISKAVHSLTVATDENVNTSKGVATSSETTEESVHRLEIAVQDLTSIVTGKPSSGRKESQNQPTSGRTPAIHIAAEHSSQKKAA